MGACSRNNSSCCPPLFSIWGPISLYWECFNMLPRLGGTILTSGSISSREVGRSSARYLGGYKQPNVSNFTIQLHVRVLQNSRTYHSEGQLPKLGWSNPGGNSFTVGETLLDPIDQITSSGVERDRGSCWLHCVLPHCFMCYYGQLFDPTPAATKPKWLTAAIIGNLKPSNGLSCQF